MPILESLSTHHIDRSMNYRHTSKATNLAQKDFLQAQCKPDSNPRMSPMLNAQAHPYHMQKPTLSQTNMPNYLLHRGISVSRDAPLDDAFYELHRLWHPRIKQL